MTKEDKELLLKDLSARLPYDTIISVNDGKYREDVKLHPHYIFDWNAERWDAKPYLRPMSSITEKEQEIYNNMTYIEGKRYISSEICSNVINFLNTYHFDYRGLIEKGLAFEAPKDMYNV